MSIKAHSISQTLIPENDRRVAVTGGSSLILGLLAAWVLSTVQFVIPDILFTRNLEPKVASVKVVLPERPNPMIEKPQVIPKNDFYKKRNSGGNSGKRSIKGKPKAIQATGVIAMLEARSKMANQSAYETMNAKMHQDVDKVLQSNARLVTKGKTVIGERAGKVSGEFMGDIGGGGGGIGDMLGSLIGDGGKQLSTKSKRSDLIPKGTEIKWGANANGRSLHEVLQVVRARTPGLRHLYNKFLRQHPGMEGKVTVRFTILPGGGVARCEIASSTTGFEAFDEEIRKAVLTWAFKAISSGETTITVPFQFAD